MTKTIWEVIEEHSKKEKTAEQVLQAVLNHYKKNGVLITPLFKANTKSAILEYEAYQEGFLTHHAREL
jgi:hypothetical protein